MCITNLGLLQSHVTCYTITGHTLQIKENIVVLSKSKYGHHLVQKLINVAKKDEVPGGCLCLACFCCCSPCGL